MDNLTHSLVGLAASKAGLEKVSPGATLLCVLAANAPDSDIVVLLFGDRWTFLQHHRGFTHSIVGTIVLGLTLPLVLVALERLIARLRRRQATIRLKGLIFASLIVSATHPLMDWTNNYGIRPLLPFSSQWVYGDFVFIVDPFMWLVFGGACFLLTSTTKLQIGFWLLLGTLLTYLVLRVPAQRELEHAFVLQVCWVLALTTLVISFKLRAAERFGHRFALAAFAVVVLYLASLSLLHWFAVRDARLQARVIASQNSESVTDVAAMSTLANPLQWLCVVETERAAYRFELSLVGGKEALAHLVRHERADASSSPAVVRASMDRRAHIFLDFARFPVARVIDPDCMTQTLVQFADLRYTEPGSRRGTFSLELPVDCPLEAAEEDK